MATQDKDSYLDRLIDYRRGSLRRGGTRRMRPIPARRPRCSAASQFCGAFNRTWWFLGGGVPSRSWSLLDLLSNGVSIPGTE